MKTQKALSKLTLLGLSAVVLTLISFISGAPFFRVLRENYGYKVYWVGWLVMMALLNLLGVQVIALILGSVWATVGLFYEFELRGWTWWVSGWVALAFSSLFLAVQGAVLLDRADIKTVDQLMKASHRIVEQVVSVYPSLKIDSEMIMYQVPSGFISILIFALGLSIIGGPAVARWFNLEHARRAGQVRGIEFRVPDYVVWVGLLGLFFVLVDLKSTALNIFGSSLLNILTAIYFFQGLAVFEVFLVVIRAGPLTRLLSYFLIVGNLFFILSLVGFMDFWIDFRRRLRKPKPISPT